MALVVLQIDEQSLPEHTKEEFEIWIKFCAGDIGGIPLSNPLCDVELTATVKEISCVGEF